MNLFKDEQSNSVALVKEGTKILTRVFAELSEPRRRNTNEGQVQFHLSLKHGKGVDREQAKQKANQIGNMLDAVIKHSKVLDVETLGISIGKLCWRLIIEVSLLEYDGSMEDTILLAILALLQGLKLSDVKLDKDGQIDVHPTNFKEIHLNQFVNMRTYGILSGPNAEPVLILDPSAQEEMVCEGFLYFVVNELGELIYVSKQGRLDIEPQILQALVQKIQVED